EQGASLAISAVVNDNAYGNTGISRPAAQTVTEAEYYLDVPPSAGGTPVAMASADGTFNHTNETVSASIATTDLALGRHVVYVRGANAAGFWGPIQAAPFEVTAPVDDPPVADDQSVFTPEDTAVAITLTASDPEDQALTYEVTDGPSSGTLSGTAPNLSYRPDSGFSGSDSFTFTVNDGTNTSAPALVAISVGVPVGPIFSDDFETNQGWVTNPAGTDTATTGQWEVGDPDQTSSGIVLQLGTTTSGSQALVTGAAGGSSAGIGDVDGGSTTVRSPDIALPAGATVDLSFQYNFAHLSNGTVDDHLRVSVVGSGGSTTVLEQLAGGAERAGTWTSFSADISSFAGQTVHLLVEAADASSGSLIEAALDDLLIESLGASNRPPTATGQSVTLAEDSSTAVTLAGTDPDDDSLTFSVTSGPADGLLSGTAPNLTYTPNADFNGADSFTFVVNDGTVDSAPAIVDLTVDPVNDLPVTSSITTSTDQGTAVAITLLADDVDGDALVYGVSGGPANGTVTGDGPEVVYTPDPGFVGVDTFDYQASDNGGSTWSRASTVTITVNGVNEAPTADNVAVTLDEDSPTPVTLVAADPEGDPLTYAVTSGPTNGSLSGTGPNLIYSPNANFNGADSFTFVVNDGEFDSNTATVTLTINPINDLPLTSSIMTSTDQGTPRTITLLGSDVDGDALVYG
ncbi:MAG: Ig-like domain-containing protein, partial [Acidimicrobiia bacterium]|nr:Ig-like domain-containing protein [Acidimicrobiia bacterium]